MGILKKKVSEAKGAEFVSVNTSGIPLVKPTATYTIGVDVATQPEPPSLISMALVNGLREEINTQLPTIRSLDNGAVAFSCEEVLRALNLLESNLQSHCAKARIEAQRAAIGREGGK